MCAQCALYVVTGVGVAQAYYRLLHPRVLRHLGRVDPATYDVNPAAATELQASAARVAPQGPDQNPGLGLSSPPPRENESPGDRRTRTPQSEAALGG